VNLLPDRVSFAALPRPGGSPGPAPVRCRSKPGSIRQVFVSADGRVPRPSRRRADASRTAQDRRPGTTGPFIAPRDPSRGAGRACSPDLRPRAAGGPPDRPSTLPGVPLWSDASERPRGSSSNHVLYGPWSRSPGSVTPERPPDWCAALFTTATSSRPADPKTLTVPAPRRRRSPEAPLPTPHTQVLFAAGGTPPRRDGRLFANRGPQNPSCDGARKSGKLFDGHHEPTSDLTAADVRPLGNPRAPLVRRQRALQRAVDEPARRGRAGSAAFVAERPAPPGKTRHQLDGRPASLRSCAEALRRIAELVGSGGVVR